MILPSAIYQLSRVEKSKSKAGVQQFVKLHHTTARNHMPYGIRLCYLPPGSSDFPALPQPKLVLDLATPEGCKAELT